MLDKIEVGKEYLNSNNKLVKVLCVGDSKVFSRHYDESEGVVDIEWAKHKWSIPKEKWFRVIAHSKVENRPYQYNTFCRSIADFTTNPENYHWIKLEEVEL